MRLKDSCRKKMKHEEKSEDAMQIDYQKKCTRRLIRHHIGFNWSTGPQWLIDHLTKFVEALPCITASVNEYWDHLIKTMVARHGCPMTFLSGKGTSFVAELVRSS